MNSARSVVQTSPHRQYESRGSHPGDADAFRFCFTVDAEPDDLWSDFGTPGFTNFMFLEDFHKRIVQAGARPTYLTTSEVVEDRIGLRAMERCLEHSDCEIGAHVHAWTRSWPFPVPDLDSEERLVRAMTHQLGAEIEEKMLDHTCRVLRNTLGVEPTSHRGGRWSLGPNTPRALANCGIKVDSTVTPGRSWKSRESKLVDGPDFASAPRYPFYLNNNNSITNELTSGADFDGDSNSVLELPVGSAWFPHAARNLMRKPWQQSVARRLGRVLRLRIGHRWLRPTATSLDDMKATMLDLRCHRVPVWVFMIHSSELVPCAPLQQQSQVDSMVTRCLDAVRFAVSLGAQPATLTEATAFFCNSTINHRGNRMGTLSHERSL